MLSPRRGFESRRTGKTGFGVQGHNQELVIAVELSRPKQAQATNQVIITLYSPPRVFPQKQRILGNPNPTISPEPKAGRLRNKAER